MSALPLTFYNRPTLRVARDLIGCQLAIRRNGKVERYVVTEAEAYDGQDDRASHAARGKTKRNEIMFRHAGHIYVYFCYGIHWMLNVVMVTGAEDYPAAVLIRGVETSDGKVHFNGPAKLTKALGITGTFNGQILSKKTGLWLEEPRSDCPKPKIVTSPRIGIDYAGPIWSQKHYRFLRA